MKNVGIAAICDIDESVRKLLEDKSIDAISIATPNHSRTMQARAGRTDTPCSSGNIAPYVASDSV